MNNFPQPLLEDIAAWKCLPLVGAGFSLNAKLPGDEKMPHWQGFTEVLALAADVSPKQSGPGVASICERRSGRV